MFASRPESLHKLPAVRTEVSGALAETRWTYSDRPPLCPALFFPFFCVPSCAQTGGKAPNNRIPNNERIVKTLFEKLAIKVVLSILMKLRAPFPRQGRRRAPHGLHARCGRAPHHLLPRDRGRPQEPSDEFHPDPTAGSRARRSEPVAA